MLRICVEKWDKYKDRLKKALKNDETLNSCNYKYLVELLVIHVLNTDGDKWNQSSITEIDDGDYQGTLLYLIPKDCYQPSEYEYLMTYAGYGSCDCCDTLQEIQSYFDTKPTEDQINDYMSLCKDLLTNIINPYNSGWRYEERFATVDNSEN